MAIARENDKEKEKERAKEHDGGEEDGGRRHVATLVTSLTCTL